MKEKKNEGITLIALVITIIVLLILAGVTLSTLFGNNGILTESQLAVEANKEANAKEQVQLAWTACETEYQSAWTQDSSVVKKDYFDADDLNKNLGTGTVKSVGYVESGKSTVTYTLEGTEYEFEIANGQVYKVGQSPDVTEPDPEETIGTLVQNVKATDYGDTINYSANGVTDWKIFYNDGENVFIIASDYVPNANIPSAMTKSGTYCAYWENGSLLSGHQGSVGISSRIRDKYGLSWAYNYPSANHNGIKAVEDLLNTDLWSGYAEGIEGAKAIGGPTLEMWMSSWNEVYPDQKLFYNIGEDHNSDGSVYEDEVHGHSIANAQYGYLIGPTNERQGSREDGERFQVSDYIELTNSGYYSSDEGYNNTLYFPHQSYNDCIAYWLASPSAADYSYGYGNYLFRVYYNGDVHGEGCSSSNSGLRPVVCLPSSVNATDGGTSWTIE